MIQRDGTGTREGLLDAFQALLLRYDVSAGPGYGLKLDPFTYLGAFATAHDTEYSSLEQAGVPFLSSGRTAADIRLVKGVVLGGQRLGPVGQAYRAGLVAVFGLKIAAQEILGAISQ